ncbi:Gfo/Idh/MocA family oxidoreductase [Streptomyces sp. GD-15H]|uniref:Gfo/Idh/MocA family protein n=1 Tax=Streptomyces sp. GD-15H TaxID=3129112 RepID=UPI00324F4278
MSLPPVHRRVAVVGTGAVAAGGHLPALRAHADRTGLVAAVGVDRGRPGAFRELAGGQVAGYTSVDAMLDAVRPDLVLIGTPPSLHRKQTVASLGAGAWVLCEKPLCLSLAAYDESAAAEEASGAYASVVFQHCYGSGSAHARELIESGELGTPAGTPPRRPFHPARDRRRRRRPGAAGTSPSRAASPCARHACPVMPDRIGSSSAPLPGWCATGCRPGGNCGGPAHWPPPSGPVPSSTRWPTATPRTSPRPVTVLPGRRSPGPGRAWPSAPVRGGEAGRRQGEGGGRARDAENRAGGDISRVVHARMDA